MCIRDSFSPRSEVWGLNQKGVQSADLLSRWGHTDIKTAGEDVYKRQVNYRVRLLTEDLTPNLQGTPAFMDMVLPGGMVLRFSAATQTKI